MINLDQAQAMEELQSRGLKANILRTEDSDEYEKGKVMNQDPNPNTKVDKGSSVNLIISGGREIEVPDLRNMTLSQAEETLKELGLRLGRTTTASSDTVESDLIIDQEQKPYSKHQVGEEINVTVSTGADNRVKTIEVPYLVGKTEADAKAIIKQHGLSLRDLNYAYSSDIQRGLVISQSIAGGTQVANNSKIDLTISQGSQEETNNQENTVDPNSNLRNVVLRVTLPEIKDQFRVMVFDVVDGQRDQAIINEIMTSDALDENGLLVLNVRAKVGASLEVIIDDETLGVYQVN